MKLIPAFFILLCSLSMPAKSQMGLYLGYNISNHYNWSKGVSFVEYDFNDQDVTNLKDPHEFGNTFKGLVIGYGVNMENFGVDMFYIRRTISSEASKIDANGREVYSKIRYSNNAFTINVFAGWPTIKFGYGFEFGRFRRRDLSEPEGDWNKNTRSNELSLGMKLLGRIYLTEEDAPVGVVVMPYWRFNPHLRNQHNSNFTRREFFKLNSFGVSAVLNINLGE